MNARKIRKNVRLVALVFLGLSTLPLNGCAPAAILPLLTSVLGIVGALKGGNPAAALGSIGQLASSAQSTAGASALTGATTNGVANSVLKPPAAATTTNFEVSPVSGEKFFAQTQEGGVENAGGCPNSKVFKKVGDGAWMPVDDTN